jgi:ADP-ribosylglycohydrolase
MLPMPTASFVPGNPGRVTYPCNCGGLSSVPPHTHTVSAAEARRRGQHPAPPPVPSPVTTPFAASVADAVRGALWGLLIGDALGAPLHWYYTWSSAQDHKSRLYGGRVKSFTATHPDAVAAHPDSAKYFSRCDPARQPVDIFNGHAVRWSSPSPSYHSTVPAGDNTLTGRLVTLLAASIAREGGVDAEAVFRDAYVPLLVSSSGAPPADRRHNDTWIDETHRVFFRNLALGAAPWEAGMSDCCLTGLAVATPPLLAYLCNRDAAVLATRCVHQLTHKTDAMAEQSGAWGDLLAALLAPVAAAAAAASSSSPAAQAPSSPHAALRAAFSTFSEGRLELDEVLARGLSDEDAYHGPATVFSSR